MLTVRRMSFSLWGMCLVLILTACSSAAPQSVATVLTATPSTWPTPSSVPALPTITPTQTAIPSPTLTPTATSTPVVYVVRVGDSAWAISRRFGVSVDALFRANGLDRTSTLRPGQELIVPVESEAALAMGSEPATGADQPQTGGSEAESATQPADAAPPEPDEDGSAMMPQPAQPSERTARQRNHAGVATATPALPARITGGQETQGSAASETIHVVKAGDSLSSIAIEYGASVEVVMDANGITDPTRLRVGQKLMIPPGTATPVPTATSYPSPSPTPAMPYAPPSLLWPINSASLPVDEPVVLSWTTVGILDPEEYYVVRLQRLRGPEVTESWTEWTQQTSWRVTPDIRAPDQTKGQLYRWEVVVMRHTATEDDGTWTGAALSSSSPGRQFLWPLPLSSITDKPVDGGISLPSSPVPVLEDTSGSD